MEEVVKNKQIELYSKGGEKIIVVCWVLDKNDLDEMIIGFGMRDDWNNNCNLT